MGERNALGRELPGTAKFGRLRPWSGPTFPATGKHQVVDRWQRPEVRQNTNRHELKEAQLKCEWKQGNTADGKQTGSPRGALNERHRRRPPAIPSPPIVSHRSHPSRLPYGSLAPFGRCASALTGPVSDAEAILMRGNGRLGHCPV